MTNEWKFKRPFSDIFDFVAHEDGFRDKNRPEMLAPINVMTIILVMESHDEI